MHRANRDQNSFSTEDESSEVRRVARGPSFDPKDIRKVLLGRRQMADVYFAVVLLVKGDLDYSTQTPGTYLCEL